MIAISIEHLRFLISRKGPGRSQTNTMRLVTFIAVISVTALILFPLESACGPAGKEKVVVAERGASRNNGKPKDAAISVALPLGAPLTAKNLGSALADTSTDSSEIILTIVELDGAESHVHNEAQMDEVQNFLTHLSDFGRAHNVLLIGANDRTCSLLRERNLPCHTDKHSDGWLPEADTINQHRRVSLLKWWFSAAIVKAGYHVLYLDTDVIVTDDVLGERWIHGRGSYDFQGLSAIDNMLSNRDFAKLEKPCPVFNSMPGRVMSQFSVPCMSTALFYAEAKPSTEALLRGMVAAVTMNPGEWEMRLFQEVVLSYLVGEGDSPVLKFRLLDMKYFSSFNVYALRKRDRLPLKAAAIFMGSVPRGQKHDAVVSLGKWRPQNWDHGSVGRARAAEMLSRHAGLTSDERSSAWLAAMKAPPGGHVFADRNNIGYHTGY